MTIFMNKFKTLVISLLFTLVTTNSLAEEMSTTGVFIDGVAAIVNEGVVLKSELNRQTDLIIVRATEAKMTLPPADVLQEQVLERLIVEEIQMQRAQRVGIQISDQQLNAAIAEIAQQANVKLDDMPAILAEQGVEYGEYRRDMRRQMILEQLRRIDVVQRISVSPREIQQCIGDLEDNAVVNSDYNLSHILISVPESATAEQFAEAEAEADLVYSELQDGVAFGELAVRYSDSQTGLEGGSLGWRKGDQLPTLFSSVVGDMQPGDYSQPIRAISGFHLVNVNEIRGVTQKSEIDQMLVRHILVTPNEIIDDETAQQRLEDALQQIRDGEDFGEIAKLLSDDPGSANDGGNTGWTGAGTFVPEFEEVANNAEIGVISEPFRSRFGWHILEVTDRRIYDNTEDLKESNCVQRVRNGKLANESELWVRRIRDEAFVEERI
jgi:peptidyl-prolyl cis-trans isomerase SurA